MLDARGELTVARLTEEIRALFAPDLVCIVLYGSAAGADFVPGLSDVNIAVVVGSVTKAHLDALAARAAKWRKERIATPLLIDRAFVERARDVFPIELHDIQEQHRLLAGEDVFSGIAVRDDHLRFQCESEARGKLLRLRELYVELGGRRAEVERLMLDSLKTFLIIMRTCNRIAGVHRAGSYGGVLEVFAQHFRCPLPTCRRLLEARTARTWRGDARATFGDYTAEIERVIAVIDRIETASD